MEVSGKRLEAISDSTIKEIENICELCEADHATTTANGKCRECEEYMCLTCFRHHLKAKSCRHHALIDTNQSTTPVQSSAANVEKCSIHANGTIKFFCRKHEIVGCGECMIPGHVACQPENIKDLSKGFQQNKDFKSLMIKLETIMTANKEIDKKILESQKENENMLDEALKEITSFRGKINNYLDRAAECIIKDAKAIESKNDKLLAKLAQDCIQLSSRITEVKEKLDAEMYQESALFIQTVDCRPRVLDIERDVSRIQTETNIRKFEFIHNKQLQDIITSTEKLGSVVNSESQSQTKSGTTKLTNESSKDATACHVKETDHVKKMIEIGQEQAKQVVGARVRPIGDFLIKTRYHGGEPGTVIAVNPDGTVNVQWDATDVVFHRRRIGLDVKLM